MSISYLYIGPSWAVKSYDPVELEKNFNYADIWSIPYFNLSRPAKTNNYFLKTFETKVPKDIRNKPIIWLWPRLDNQQWLDICYKEDWMQQYYNKTNNALEEINSLGNKVLIIGSHSDPKTNLCYNNIDFFEISIQQHIGQQCKETLDWYFDFESAHCCIHAYDNETRRASKSLVNDTYIGLKTWDKWESKGWIYDCHPTAKAVESFALKYKDKIIHWIEKNIDN